MNKNEFWYYNAQLELDTDKFAGWIGGNPPAIFDTGKYNNTLNGYSFYFTFILPDKKKQISIFLPEFSVYLKQSIYPAISIKVIEHPISSEGNNSEYAMNVINKHFISLSLHSPDKIEDFSTIPPLIKLGKEPELIQNKLYYTEKLKEDGYEFLLQLDEDGYPDDLLKGSAPLCYGSLYLYCQPDNTQITAGFWQST